LHETLHASGQKCDLPYSLFWAVFSVHDLVISPEPFIKKCKSLAGAKPYLDVVDGRVRFAWMDDDATDFMDRADAIGLGISYNMLLMHFRRQAVQLA
jgi:hypothetical protein